MGSLISNWDDTETNRRVELVIDYQLEDGHVELTRVDATKITFADTKRVVRVYTQGGRQVLARQAEQAGWLHGLREKIGAGELHEIAHHTTEVKPHELDPSLAESA